MKKPGLSSQTILVIIIIIEATIGVVSNAIIETLPSWIQPYLWLAGPLFLILVTILIFLMLIQDGRSFDNLKQTNLVWIVCLLLIAMVLGILTLSWWRRQKTVEEEPFIERAGLSWSPDSKHLAFVSKRDGNEEIYSMSLNGTNLRRVTDHASQDRFPAWSPDGEKIAFQSNRDGTDAIYITGLSGHEFPSRLTSGRDPAWSPDGYRIAFQDNATGDFEVYVIDIDGSDRVNMSDSASSFDGSPAWCSDGIQLAFESSRVESLGIYTVEYPGQNLRPVVTSTLFAWAGEASWSPECDRISFQGGANGSQTRLHVVDVGEDDSKIRLLALEFMGRDAEWSPDGRYVAFFSRSEGKWGIYIYDLKRDEVLPVPYYSGPKWWIGGLLFLIVLAMLIVIAMGKNGRETKPSIVIRVAVIVGGGAFCIITILGIVRPTLTPIAQDLFRATPTPIPILTPIPTRPPTDTSSPIATPTGMPSPIATPTDTLTPTSTATPTTTNTPTATATDTPSPTATPTGYASP